MAKRRAPGRLPSANEIAQAVVMACRIFGEDAILIVGERPQHSRARCLALEALAAAFPDANKTLLAEKVGFPKPPAHGVIQRHARKAPWWRDEHVDEIVGELVAPEYGALAL